MHIQFHPNQPKFDNYMNNNRLFSAQSKMTHSSSWNGPLNKPGEITSSTTYYPPPPRQVDTLSKFTGK